MIDREQVHKVAHLARLALTDQEEETLTAQLQEILGYFDQLSELDTSDVPPTTRAIEVVNVVRADELKINLSRDAILDCAPERDGEFFKVPKIINEG
jgi:aspartyl-tRNA(Asn)/glutamyl-tRNA(Gln) amidotransferase subunit C